MKLKSLGWTLALAFAVVAIPIAPKGTGTARDIEGPPPPGGAAFHLVADIEGPPPPGGMTIKDIEGPPPPGGTKVTGQGINDIEGPPPPGGLA